MKITSNLNIECGETTCYHEPGEHCRFLGTKKFGSMYVCMLFPSDSPRYKDCGSYTVLNENADGGIARCEACLMASEGMQDPMLVLDEMLPIFEEWQKDKFDLYCDHEEDCTCDFEAKTIEIIRRAKSALGAGK